MLLPLPYFTSTSRFLKQLALLVNSSTDMAAKTGDSRFARLQTDPRFRRPKQKNVKVEIDDRFKDVLQSEEFGGKAKGKGKGKGKASDGGELCTASDTAVEAEAHE